MDAPKGRTRLGIVLLVASFVPYLLMLGLVAASDDQGSWVWVVMGLWGVSIVLWYVGLLLLGPTAYRAARDRVKGWVPHRKREDPTP